MPPAWQRTKRRRVSETHLRAGPHPLSAAQDLRCGPGAAEDVTALPMRCYEPKAREKSRAQVLALPALVLALVTARRPFLRWIAGRRVSGIGISLWRI